MKLFRHTILAVAMASSVSAPAFAAVAAPQLSFSSYASVYGYLSSSYSSPFLGDAYLSVNGASDYKYFNAGSGSTDIASVAYTVEAGHGGEGDPLYDIVTTNGQFGFSYEGQAQAAGTQLRTELSLSSTNVSGDKIYAWQDGSNSSLGAYSNAQWNQSFYIGATASRTAGSYGAILVGITLDGSFVSEDKGYMYSYLQASSSFVDTAGVSYNSNFRVDTYSQDASWTGSRTVYKKLLFQYGTVFNLSLYQETYGYENGSADFFNTGAISFIEIPFGAELETGAGQAGLGSVADLYGEVFQSASVDAENTNWDFGNNGGGFTAPDPVPEPSTYAMLIAGFALMAGVARRRKA